jgi:transcription elongation factor Elf1
MNVSTATTADLVKFYNAHATKPVKKFADRKTAERRVAELAKAIQPPKAEVVREFHCPECGATENLTCGEVKLLRGMQHLVNEHIADCHNCGHEWNTLTGKPVRKTAASAERSAAIVASWKNKDVAAARAVRHGVVVVTPKGEKREHKSVREAFMVLALPLGQHIKFRGALKAAGRAEFGGYKFQLA